MTRPSTPVQDLPPALAERLRRLADDQTAGSRPWPQVTQAVRRSRRRRLTGLSAVTAVGVVLSGAAYASLIPPTTRSGPASDATHQASLTQLRKSGYAGPTSGSLAGDSDWISQLRRRAAELVPQLPEGGGRGDVASADDVLVPWTGELDGHRYAVVTYPGPPLSTGDATKPIPTFAAAVLVGARAEEMTVKGATPWIQPPYQTTSGQVIWVPSEDPDPQGRALVFVLGPTVTGAKVATSREFFTEGTSPRTEWRPLRREGGVWLGSLTHAELYLSDVRLEGPSDSTSNGPLEPLPQERFRAIAPAGTDLRVLDCASQGSSDLGGSLVDQPMLAATTRISSSQALAAAVLRAPGGPWLVSFCKASIPSGRRLPSTILGAVYPAPADPGGFLAAIEAPDDKVGPGGYLVATPAGATTAQIGTTTVKVTNRLAYFPRTADRTGPQTVRALDAAGQVIASTRSVVGNQ